MTDSQHTKLEQSIPPFGFHRRRKQRSYRLWLVSILALLAGVLFLAYWLSVGSRFVSTNDAYVTGNLIALQPQTSGTVAEVLADNTQFVSQGQALVRLDGLQAQVALERAQADLADSVRQTEVRFSQAGMLRQKLAAKDMLLQRNRRDLARYHHVAADGVVSAQQVEDSEFQVRELEAGVREVQAELAGAEAQIQGADLAGNPRVLQAAAALKQAYLDFVRQTIDAPVAGFVANRSIQPGEQVKPETKLLSIVPLDYLWVEANFLEDELAKVRPGQPVEIKVDLYGGEVVFHGQVLALAAGTGSVFGLLPPNNATGNYIHIVERVPVRIGLRSDELKAHPLRPGLSAKVSIDTSRPGQPVLQPLTGLPDNGYKTDIYRRQLDGADALIQQIIEKNRLPASVSIRKL